MVERPFPLDLGPLGKVRLSHRQFALTLQFLFEAGWSHQNTTKMLFWSCARKFQSLSQQKPALLERESTYMIDSLLARRIACCGCP